MNTRIDRGSGRRKGQSIWRKMFRWLLRERRSPWDRRARVDTTVKEIQG